MAYQNYITGQTTQVYTNKIASLIPGISSVPPTGYVPLANYISFKIVVPINTPSSAFTNDFSTSFG